ncbi:hypothetical protein SEPCBS119000_003673 [Sporothrix epigloea]|uniref:Peptidase A1 domain-containing protein n=1 Tax=Sporothrix epigloea TaxID=1892477 RepID=A0ABP0DMX7_9PEZI
MLATFQAQQDLKANLGLQRLKVLVNENFKPNGRKSYLKVMRKFGIKPTLPGPYQMGICTDAQKNDLNEKEQGNAEQQPVSEVLLKKKADGSLGKVPAEDQESDLEYLCEVSIGTPAQKLKLDFDTGSADLWVVSTELPSHVSKGHAAFNSHDSTSFKPMQGYSWKIKYGDSSSASGDVGTDSITIGGLTVPNQAVELAKKMSDQFMQSSGDGLFGLAWSSINTVSKCFIPRPQLTPMENLIANKILPEGHQFFTACLYSSRDAEKESFYTFGHIDSQFSGKKIAWTNVDNSNGWWQFPSTSITIAGEKIHLPGNTAIADTGTTLCILSDKACKALYAAIPGAKYDETQQGWVIPASVTLDQLPTVKIAVGDNDFELQPEDLVYGEPEDGVWFGAVQSRGDMGLDILGDVFLKSIYAIFDVGNVRFGAISKIEPKQNLGETESVQTP